MFQTALRLRESQVLQPCCSFKDFSVGLNISNIQIPSSNRLPAGILHYPTTDYPRHSRKLLEGTSVLQVLQSLAVVRGLGLWEVQQSQP